MRTPAFWIIALSFATFSMLVTGLFFHQVALFNDRGISAAGRGAAVSDLGGDHGPGDALVRPPARPPADQADVRLRDADHDRRDAGARDGRTTSASAIVYSVVFGINNAAMHAHISYLWPRYFGRRYLGSIQGTAQTIGVVGASLGPIPLGAAFDLFGSYQGALLLLAVLPVLCALAILLMRPPRLEDYPAGAAA